MTSLLYEIRAAPSPSSGDLLIGVEDFGKGYSDNFYAVGLRGKFKARAATLQEWDRGERLPNARVGDIIFSEVYGEIVIDREGVKYRGKLYRTDTGESRTETEALPSPGGRWIAVYSDTSKPADNPGIAGFSGGGRTSGSQNKPSEDETDQLFADYPRGAALESIIYSHRNFGRKSKDLILHATWFPDGNPQVAYRCFASVKGGIETHRWVYDWAIQASHTSQLDELQLESLKNSIKTLPEGAKSPPLADLLIVSFREGETWKTRTYDRKRLPEEVKNIDKITDCTTWYKNP